MPGELMVLNPRRKKRRKLTAKQEPYFGKRKRRRSRVVAMASNPRKRRRRSRHMYSNPKRHHRIARRSFRRNPITGGGIEAALVSAAWGVAGVAATGLIEGYIGQSAPMSLPPGIVTAGIAIGVGYAGDAVLGAKVGTEMMVGGLISAFSSFVSGMGQGGMGQGGMSRYPRMSRYMGYVRRIARINRRRALRGVPPLSIRNFPGRKLGAIMRPQRRRRLGANPLSIKPSLSGNPSAFTKFRVLRNGGTRASTLGYTGPARTLGRYGTNGRNT